MSETTIDGFLADCSPEVRDLGLRAWKDALERMKPLLECGGASGRAGG